MTHSEAQSTILIGQSNQLQLIYRVDFGVYLGLPDLNPGVSLPAADRDQEILMPLRYVPEGSEPGDTIEAFVYYDSEDRLIATTDVPKVQVGGFGLLKVVAVESIGAFLDWGLPKDLFLPFAEQTRQLRPGQQVIVYVYLDKSMRISASMRLERNAVKKATYKDRESVNLLVIGKTDLGFKAIIDGRHVGVIYSDEVFQPLSYGQELKGFIKKMRPDGKIDLSLNQIGRQASDDIAPKILELLKSSKGFLAINDKTSAEKIHELFGVSKKKYKIALGNLYKKRAIRVEVDGIYLVAVARLNP